MKSPLLDKLLGKSAEIDAAVAEATKALNIEFEAFKIEANGVAEAYATQVSELTTALGAASELATSLQAQLDAANGKLAEVTASAAAKAAATRKEKLIAAAGEAKADAWMELAADMDDEKFDKLVDTLGAQAAAEAKSPMFTEVGASAQADASKTTSKSKEMLLLEEKYGAADKR